jgi:hypothetical protein
MATLKNYKLASYVEPVWGSRYSDLLRAGLSGVWILTVASRFLFSKTPRTTPGPIPPRIQWVPELFTEIRRSRREVNHSSLYSAKIKTEYNYTSGPLVCLQGVQRDIFTFTDFLQIWSPFWRVTILNCLVSGLCPSPDVPNRTRHPTYVALPPCQLSLWQQYMSSGVKRLLSDKVTAIPE